MMLWNSMWTMHHDHSLLFRVHGVHCIPEITLLLGTVKKILHFIVIITVTIIILMANNILWHEPWGTPFIYPFINVPQVSRDTGLPAWKMLTNRSLSGSRYPGVWKCRSAHSWTFPGPGGVLISTHLLFRPVLLRALALAVLRGLRKHTPVFFWVMSLTGSHTVPKCEAWQSP